MSGLNIFGADEQTRFEIPDYKRVQSQIVSNYEWGK